MNSVKLLFFSLLRDLTGCDEKEVSIPEDGLLISELLEQLFTEHEGLHQWQDKLLIAINCEYAEADALVKPGDEVAVMPPVQGG